MLEQQVEKRQMIMLMEDGMKAFSLNMFYWSFTSAETKTKSQSSSWSKLTWSSAENGFQSRQQGKMKIKDWRHGDAQKQKSKPQLAAALLTASRRTDHQFKDKLSRNKAGKKANKVKQNHKS